MNIYENFARVTCDLHVTHMRTNGFSLHLHRYPLSLLRVVPHVRFQQTKFCVVCTGLLLGRVSEWGGVLRI